jgi:hypothetical protein
VLAVIHFQYALSDGMRSNGGGTIGPIAMSDELTTGEPTAAVLLPWPRGGQIVTTAKGSAGSDG